VPDHPIPALAALILLDQVPRNIFRHRAEAKAYLRIEARIGGIPARRPGRPPIGDDRDRIEETAGSCHSRIWPAAILA
jgi:hypothetical protein